MQVLNDDPTGSGLARAMENQRRALPYGLPLNVVEMR